MKTIVHTFILGTFLATASTGHSQDLLVTEPFAYGSGNLKDSAGGQGWAGPWRDAPQSVVGEASLSSAVGETPETSGGYAFIKDGDWMAKRTLASPIGGESDIWISLLARNDKTAVEKVYFYVDLMPGTGVEKEAVSIGKEYNSPKWTVRAGGKMAKSAVDSNDSTVFLVAHISKGGAGERIVRLYVDPELGTVPMTPDAEIPGVDVGPLQEVRVRAGGGPQAFSIDEIRIGKTYASVAPKAP